MPVTTLRSFLNSLTTATTAEFPVASRSIRRVVAIDARVEQWALLAVGVLPDTKVVVLEPTDTALVQLAEVLERESVQQLHLVAHGQPGWLQVGRQGLSIAALAGDAAAIVQRWGRALGDRAEIAIYGCRSAAGALGEQWLSAIARLTGAAVAGATEFVGAAQRGGVWRLDRAIGTLSAPLPFTPEAISAYPGLLAPCVPNQFFGIAALEGTSQDDLVSIDLATGEVRIQRPNLVATGALARSPQNNRVYTLPNGSSSIQYWDSTSGESGALVASGVNYSIAGGSDRMAFDAFGNLFLGNTRQIDLVNVEGSGTLGVVQSFNIARIIDNVTGQDIVLTDNRQLGRGSGDFAFDPSTGSLYLAARDNLNGLDLLYRIDPTADGPGPLTTGPVTSPVSRITNVVARRLVARPIGTTGGFTGLAFGYDGKLYAATLNKSLQQLNLETGAVERTLPTTFNGQPVSVGDLATLSITPQTVNVVATKTDNLLSALPGSTVSYVIRVENTSGCDVTADFPVTVVDPLPGELLNPVWQTPTINGVGSTSTNNLSGAGAKVALNAGSSIEFRVTGQLSPTSIGTVTNTARATLPEGLLKPGLSPLEPQVATTTDTTAIGPNVVDTGRPAPTPVTSPLGSFPTTIGIPFGVGGTALDCGCEAAPIATTWQVPNPVAIPDLPALVIPIPPEVTGDRRLGSPQNDVIDGTAANDFITGFAGSDLLRGNGGADEVIGDVGDDTIFGGLGFGGLGSPAALGAGVDADRLGGGEGDDVLNGNEGEDVVFGGQGRDTINGGKDGDILFGDRGSDVVRGDQGADTITGGVGRPDNRPEPDDRDLIFGNTENDVIMASEGEDTVFGGQGDDYIRGGKEADWLYGDRGSDTIGGDLGDDTLIGGTGVELVPDPSGRDLLFGLDGNDLLFGNEAEDTLIGGEGNDRAFGGRDADLILGDGGNDTLSGDQGNDTILGSGGSNNPIGGGIDDDLIFGGPGQDNLNGGQGQDTIRAGRDDDLVYGGKDNDLLYGDFGNDAISGDLGNDTLIGGNGNDRDPDQGNDLLLGGGNDDLLLGNAGDDSLSGDDGQDTARGGQGSDYLWGGAGADLLMGDRGNDTICGGSDADTIYGNNPDQPRGIGVGSDDDFLSGNAGNDLIFGNDGNDRIDGCEDDDRIFGGKGNDTLLGSQGNDVLFGDQGDDLLIGGQGIDTFVIGLNRGVDTIVDYFGGSDRIGLAEGLKLSDLNFVEIDGSIDIRVDTTVIARLQNIPSLAFVNGADFISV